MSEVRRAGDGELCGHVERAGDEWRALTVFGAELGRHTTRDAASADVLERGLAVLALRWELVDHGAGTAEVVCIQEVGPSAVTVVLAPYAMPGLPVRSIPTTDVRDGRVELRPA